LIGRVAAQACVCRLWAVACVASGPFSDESALEVALPPDRRLDRRPSAYTTMRYTNRQPLPFYTNALLCNNIVVVHLAI